MKNSRPGEDGEVFPRHLPHLPHLPYLSQGLVSRSHPDENGYITGTDCAFLASIFSIDLVECGHK